VTSAITADGNRHPVSLPAEHELVYGSCTLYADLMTSKDGGHDSVGELIDCNPAGRELRAMSVDDVEEPGSLVASLQEDDGPIRASGDGCDLSPGQAASVWFFRCRSDSKACRS
jgi:hypothetical protein